MVIGEDVNLRWRFFLQGVVSNIMEGYVHAMSQGGQAHVQLTMAKLKLETTYFFFSASLESLNVSVIQNKPRTRCLEVPRSRFVPKRHVPYMKRHEPRMTRSIISDIENTTKIGQERKSRTFEIITSGREQNGVGEIPKSTRHIAPRVRQFAQLLLHCTMHP